MDLWGYSAVLHRVPLTSTPEGTRQSASRPPSPTISILPVFSIRGVKLDPGGTSTSWEDFDCPRLPRRILKLLESILNLSALTVRFSHFASRCRSCAVTCRCCCRALPARSLVRPDLPQNAVRRSSSTAHDLLPPRQQAEAHKAKHSATCIEMVDGIICHSANISTRPSGGVLRAGRKDHRDPSRTLLLRPSRK